MKLYESKQSPPSRDSNLGKNKNSALRSKKSNEELFKRRKELNAGNRLQFLSNELGGGIWPKRDKLRPFKEEKPLSVSMYSSSEPIKRCTEI